MSSDCQLGDYRVTFIKNGRKLSTGRADIVSIDWQRTVDDVSNATVRFATTGPDCCGQLGAVDHWNTDVIISVDDDVMWRGPVRKATASRGFVTVEASDVLAWNQLRIIRSDLNFVDTDVSDIFVGIWNDAVMAIDPPYSSLIVYASGTKESRKISASQHRKAWNVIQEMLDGGLDITTFGSRIIVGAPAFTAIRMTDQDVIGDIQVVKDGDEYTNRVIADAAKDTFGTYPPGPAAGNNGYPLVEDVISDSQLQDVQSAENSAKAKYDFAVNGVRRVRADGGLILLPDAPLNPRTVVAGQLVTFTAGETCFSATETLRLGSMNVHVEAARETVTIDLQPTGSVQGLDSV